MAKTKRFGRKAPVKVIWYHRSGDKKWGFFHSEKEAKDAISDEYDRSWSQFLILFYSETLDQYISIPKDDPKSDLGYPPEYANSDESE